MAGSVSFATAGEAGRTAIEWRETTRRAQATEVSVVVVAELAAQKVQRERVDARVDERQAERGNLEDMPEHIVFAVFVKVIPEIPNVSWKPADDEHSHERQYESGDFLTRLQLNTNTDTHLKDYK